MSLSITNSTYIDRTQSEMGGEKFSLFLYAYLRKESRLMQTVIISSLIGGIIAFGFGLLNMKLNKMIKTSEKRHEEHKVINIAERELLLGVADVTILTARKVNDRNSVNGELEKSIEYLTSKKHTLQDETRKIAFDHLEN